MEISFFKVLITVASLVVLAIPGYILSKCKMLPEKAAEAFSTLVLYVCQTAMVFNGFQEYNFDSKIGLNMLIVFGLTFAIHLIMIAIVSLFVKGKREAQLKCVKYGSVFGNCGYMGFPFLRMLFPNNGEVMIYAAVVIAVWNILNWTFGVYMITGDKKQISIKKIVLNPVIIAVVTGFLIFVIAKRPIVDLAVEGSRLDLVLTNLMASVKCLADAVTPLSMIVIGMRLAGVNFKQLFVDELAYVQSGLKLIAMSLLTIVVVVFLPVSEMVKYTLFFTLSMPAATSTALFAVKFNGDSRFGSICVLLSTVLSIITIPLMFLAFNALIGLM